MSTATLSKSGEALGTGRRKTAVARVRARSGSGRIVINGRPFDEFFPNEQDRGTAVQPLMVTGKRESVDLTITCSGGGMTGQAGACKLGIARALIVLDGTTEEPLRKANMMTRDSRMKERKKYGFRGARRGTQFSKR
jgi:small subunit ribosomal protein S9